MKWFASILLLCLLAGCTNTAIDGLNKEPTISVLGVTLESAQTTSNSVAQNEKMFEEKEYALSELNLHHADASYIRVSIDEYISSTSGFVQATVGRIREHDGVYALDVKVTKAIKGTDQEYMQLLYTARSPEMMFEEGKEYIFPFGITDSLDNPEPLYIIGTLLYYPIDGNPTYWNEPLENSSMLFSNYSKRIGEFDKTAMKASGICTQPSDKIEDTADYADLVAIVDIERIEVISPATSVAFGTCTEIFKGSASGQIGVGVPTGTPLGESLISMTKLGEYPDFYIVSSRKNAVTPVSDAKSLQAILESIRTVKDVVVADSFLQSVEKRADDLTAYVKEEHQCTRGCPSR
jgi:hypothetical protein